MFVRAVKVEH